MIIRIVVEDPGKNKRKFEQTESSECSSQRKTRTEIFDNTA